jgi:hypothetical protein
MYHYTYGNNITVIDMQNLPQVNPLPLLFKALLQGLKDHVSFSGHLIYVLKQERFRAFRPAWDI